MEKRLLFGVIGCGWIAENGHLPALLTNNKVNVEALYDVNIKNVKTLALKYGIKKYYNDLNSFWNSGIEAVIIATPNYTHTYYLEQAVSRGIHVLCEKPIATKYDDLCGVLEKQKDKSVVYMSGYVNKWRDEVMDMEEVIKADQIGKVTNIDMGWFRRSGIPRPGSWFTNKECAGGGVLIDLGSHMIDIGMMLLGNPRPSHFDMSAIYDWNGQFEQDMASWFGSNEKVNYFVDVETSAYANVLFDDEKRLSIGLSWRLPINGDTTYFHITGTKGEITLKTLFGFSTEYLREKHYLEVNSCGKCVFSKVYEQSNCLAKKAFIRMITEFINKIIGKSDCFKAKAEDFLTVEVIDKLYQNMRIRNKIEDNWWRKFLE